MRRQLVRITGLVLLAMCWAPLSWAAQGWQPLTEKINKSEHDPRQYEAIKLANGMTVLLVSDAQAPKSLAALALPVGSLEDPNSQLGLAHYLEHMVLMGSKRYPEPENLSEFLKKHGGSHNASTASYRTAFYLEVENDALEPAVDRMADAIAEPLLDPGNADRERNAVNAELTMARSRDGMRMAQVGAETLNPAHPSARFSGGNLDTLKDKPDSKLHDELTGFYKRYYSANLMMGVLYGNQPLPQLADIAAKTFGRVPNHDASVPPITVPAVTPEQQGIIIHYVPAQPRKQLKVEFRIDNNSAAFRSKTDTYISYLIGNRSKNTLSDWLQKQGLADAINAGADPMVDRNGGVFAISVSLTDKGLAQRDQVVAAIFNYLKMLRSEGIKQSYFDEISHVLNLDFRYPSITRDMDYIEWLVDTMLRVPVEHALDAPYLADRYDPKAIAERLDAMTPQNARIWFVSPDEPHNKTAYFVNAPYQVDKITPQRFTQWQQLESGISLSLPALNPYIPDDFTLTKPSHEFKKPEKVVDKPGLRVLYMPSRYFADEPKADVTVAFRNAKTMDSARNQVLFSLTDYLAGLALDQLSYQASVGGLSFSTSPNNGLMFNANGFTQRLPQLLTALIEGYSSFTPTEDQLAQAKSWYLEQLDAAEKGKAFELAIQPVQMVSRVPYSERSERREVLKTLTLKDVLAYRDSLLAEATPELLVVGNMSKQQVDTLASTLKHRLGCTGSEWWHGEDVVVDKNHLANLQQVGSSTDSALAAVYVPTGYDEVTGMAYSSLLGQIIQPWFYSQLRTQEQLGYAVFAFPMSVGRQWGVGFLLQSNSKQPAYLYQRYQDFYPKTEKRLRDMSEADFEQYKQALINELKQRPQTLSEEASRFANDFDRGNFAFDTRQKLIAQVQQLTPAKLADYFHQAVIQPQGLAVLSQVSGSGQDKADYAAPKDWVTYPNASALQQILPRKVATP
ncbi:pitrilysin [Serratia marcescens]|uniref:pitrilysin n=1 Tax=Serratia marcescens TaxID=615 RepID=UPI0004FFCAAE|nr:pitrilysin [Serratia marcescens]KFL03567.1 peptidase M16 inactive domain protein [Serratia marcescens]MCC3251305.1 pitrilysin [Serratia marcescens]PNU43263.1 pitrilysin [Serratia marcescens subsp. marcescens ATCC 13880]QDL87888.1 pitrilysin [Serratia marcescens subsp. marcescens ATCC 13880]QSO60185.1 pitrilysin [Serratia marcescens subsp. marcescens ATCC 13880]